MALGLDLWRLAADALRCDTAQQVWELVRDRCPAATL